MSFATIKAEVKLTTGGAISLAARELEALSVSEPHAVGIVAALFVGSDRDRDCRWIIVDAADYHGRRGESVSVLREGLIRTVLRQTWLAPLRQHVDDLWPPFLQAFLEVASAGHAALVAELGSLHQAGQLRDVLPREPVLVVEHLAAVRRLVERHGESDAGRIVQDLLAYLVALAGYRKVTLNAVGVPDFVVEDHVVTGPADRVTVSMARDDAQRVVALCRAAGDDRLARVVEREIRVK